MMTEQRVAVEALAEDAVDVGATVIARAFQDEPIMQYTLPDPVERARRAPAFFAQGLRLARLVGVAYVPVGRVTGAVFGWPVPTPVLAPARAADAGLTSLDELLGAEAAGRFTVLTDLIDEQGSRLVPPPYWSLSAIGVDPAWQGQGVGSALVRAFLARAASDALPTYLWTDRPANVDFYRRLGLVLVGEGVAPPGNVSYWMFRGDPP